MSGRSRAYHRRAPTVLPGDPELVDPPETFTAEVRLFAWVAELADCRRVELELAHGATAATVVGATLDRAGLDEGLGFTGSVRLTVNREYAPPGLVIEPGDELALIPPIAGGAPAYIRVTDEPLDLQRVYELVATEAGSSIVTFSAVTTEVEKLHFEAYEEMARARIDQIVEDLMQSYRLEAIVVEHRVGGVSTGQPSVIVAVSARERPAAFAAAREAIDRVKAEAPIWKLEIDSGYRSWVRGAIPFIRS
jgi:molybdopterin synthase catalytic subunit